MGGDFEIKLKNLTLDIFTFQIMNFQSLNISQNHGSKLYFFYFSISYSRDERGNDRISVI